MGEGKRKRTLLFISIDFPPARTSGIYRPVFFTKYLTEAGWDITLLTASTHLSTVNDESLYGEIDPRLNIVRASAPMPRRLTGRIYDRYKRMSGEDAAVVSRPSFKTRAFIVLKKLVLSPIFRLIDNFILVPDNYIIWVMKNLFKAYRIIKTRQITHLLTTSQPQSVQVMGLILKYLTGVRLIADFRDSWTDHQKYSFKIREKIEKALEKKVLARAGAIINMSDGDLVRLRERMPQIPENKLFAVTNGYNEKDFVDHVPTGRIGRDGPLTLLYVGSMYPHSGDSTVDALRILSDAGYGDKDIRFTVIGFSDESFNELVGKYKVEQLMNNIGFLNHDDLLKSYHDYDIMYLVTGGTPYYHAGMLPGKIFEYMRLGRPVLHAGLDGSAHHILSRAGIEIFVPLDDADGIAGAMITLLKKKKTGALTVEPNWDYIRSFEWRELGKRLDRIMTAVD